jgi:8-oxo-dGTP diphosphatase/2-hydroxy-dATP diphosphatase
MKKQLTLCMILQNNRILLAMKKRGFGAGKWNGVGGKLEAGETVEQAAKREAWEEIGVTITDMEKFGVIDFTFQEESDPMEVHIFKVNQFDGTPEETEEMKPEWFDVDKIPFADMWPDDEFWLPLLLQGKKFKGRFLFDRPSSKEYTAKILEQELAEVSEL